MLRRLVLGYLALVLVVLAAFGVPFGILWANHARSDELKTLRQSASDVGAAVAAPLQGVLSGHRASGDGALSDPDHDGDGVLTRTRLTGVQHGALESALAEFTGSSRSVVAVLGADGGVVAAVGPARGEAGHLLGRRAVEEVSSQGGTPTTGQAGTPRGRLLFAAVPVRVRPSGQVPRGRSAASADQPKVPVAVALVGEPAAVVDGRVRAIAASLAGLGAGILVVAAVAGWALVRSLVRPLKRIELAVTELGSGDLSARAPTGAGPPELDDLAETVNVMAMQLGELIGAQRTFVADASHQLRTPLTALRLRLEGLRADVPTPSEELGAILDEVERLSRLVTGLLGLARAEEAPATPAATDVAELAAARGEAWLGVAEEQGVRLVHDADGPHVALAVAEDLGQALDNLLDNAVRVSPSGAAVRLAVADEGGWVTLHVVDEGPGMPPEDRRHAFDRFWTRRAEAGRGGSGLGLAIVDRLVRNSGGEVELRDGRGGVGIDAVVRLRSA